MVSADVNGDGRMDLVYRSPVEPFAPSSIANTTIRMRLGGPLGFLPAQETGLPPLTSDQLANGSYPAPLPFDINGDGNADLAIPHTVSPTNTTTWTLFQNALTTFV